MAYIHLKNVSKIYNVDQPNEIKANNNISFDLQKGELTIIVGESGAGKSTLLDILGGMDTVSSGEVTINKETISNYNHKQLTAFRRHAIGFVFQFYNLLPNLTAKENIELAAELVPESLNIDKVLDKVGLSQRQDNFPGELSGGEQQRVAIARAIVKNPALLLCDEPTGALDYQTGKKILQFLQDFCHNRNKNVIIVTHNQMIKPMADHIIEIADGQIKQDQINTTPTPVAKIEW
ncbi:ABC transporter ATP-binding protein [Bombilactobacillus bombi]|uniref:ABC transporter ATP-binding protein n=1 Tax=Bombilactobacillus bombi TaxID=1303590 RepID=UPI0015E5FF1C|nr:ABC transporter ATP-binding protein [Bombilactobacillus bombi]MBA1393670.1 ABC transporter ATP-binding protein [Lactobacillus sp. XV13L]MBA1434752.1 ABC transporter ATP-binding protein [Bombilactobacillus bombi]